MNISRRDFLRTTTMASALSATTAQAAPRRKEPLFKISLAQWTINKELFAGDIDNLEFAQVAYDHGIHGLEYVNQFFMDKATDTAYLKQMKQRAEDLGVKSVLIMCDREGNIGDPDSKKRAQAVDNHRKWIDAAEFLGCHSIRVNAYSEGSWDEQAKLVAEGLGELTRIGDRQDIGVIVENHGGYSSNADWVVKVMQMVDHPNCGTLPDFGNFRIKDGVTYDSYRGVKVMMPYAKGVSVKDRVTDDYGQRYDLDYDRMMRIVINAGFHGYCGIEHGGYAGLNEARRRLEAVRERLAAS